MRQPLSRLIGRVPCCAWGCYFAAALVGLAFDADFGAVCVEVFAVGDADGEALFAFAVDATCVLFGCTCVSGARCTGSVTASELCGLIAVDDRWFHRRRSSTETLKRSAMVTRVSPMRVT